MRMRWILTSSWVVAGFGFFGGTGCDTGFGQPCELPSSPEIRTACEEGEPSVDAGMGNNEVVTESKPSCALKEYAGCETRICLVYRGSSPFCSVKCDNDADCEGGAVCRPLLGDADEAGGDPCAPDDSGFNPECYCVRGGDADR